MFGSSPFSPHSDILCATPVTEDDKRNLNEEIKRRAKISFTNNNYTEAELLYSKAIEVLPDASLYTNRSLALFNQGKTEDSLVDAEMSISLDASWSKGYYRKGQACFQLKRTAEALASFQRGYELDPQNKTVETMIQKCQKAMQEGPATNSQQTTSTKALPKQEKTSTQAQVSKETKTTESSSKVELDESVNLKAEELRGYKIVNGKKTTFFNKDLTEDEKQLIGDITPQKITEPVVENQSGDLSGRSAWNSAGTWEEKNFTDWAKSRITELITDLRYDIPSEYVPIQVIEIKDLVGDAQIAMVRGKKRYIFDFSFKVRWEVELTSGNIKGSLHYPDVSTGCDGEYDANLELETAVPHQAQNVIQQYVRSKNKGLQSIIKLRIDQFVREFMSRGDN